MVRADRLQASSVQIQAETADQDGSLVVVV